LKFTIICIFQRKCDRYWPDLGSQMHVEEFVLFTRQEKMLGGILQRKIQMTVPEASLVVLLHYCNNISEYKENKPGLKTQCQRFLEKTKNE